MIELSGQHGKLFAGYRVAATLGKWQLIRKDDVLNSQLTEGYAIVVEYDRYWIAQRPMILSVWMGKAWWSWSTIQVGTLKGNKISLSAFGNPEATKNV